MTNQQQNNLETTCFAILLPNIGINLSCQLAFLKIRTAYAFILGLSLPGLDQACVSWEAMARVFWPADYLGPQRADWGLRSGDKQKQN